MMSDRHDHTSALAVIGRRLTEYAGLAPRAWELKARSVQRQQRLALASLDDYANYLLRQPDNAELVALVEAVRTGETRLFRHEAQIRALIAAVLPKLDQRSPDTLRIWSAGCATGEECWTLAMICARHLPTGHGFEILGTDISPDVIARAKDRQFDDLSAPESATWDNYMPREDGPRQSATQSSLRAAITFEVHNLLAPPPRSDFDLVMCRNVLMYFDSEAKTQAFRNITASLRDEGVLFVGYSENARGIGTLQAESNCGATYYRKGPVPDQAFTRPSVAAEQAGSAPRVEMAQEVRRVSDDDRSVEPPSSRPIVIELEGSYRSPDDMASALRPLLQHPGRPGRILLDAVDYIDDSCAQILLRLQRHSQHQQSSIQFITTRTGIRHWLGRHDLIPPGGET